MGFLTKAAVGLRRIGWTTVADCVDQVWDGVSGTLNRFPYLSDQVPTRRGRPNPSGVEFVGCSVEWGCHIQVPEKLAL